MHVAESRLACGVVSRVSGVDAPLGGLGSGENGRERAPWFGAAAAGRFLGRLGDGGKGGARGRDGWECGFCGGECFCVGLPE